MTGTRPSPSTYGSAQLYRPDAPDSLLIYVKFLLFMHFLTPIIEK